MKRLEEILARKKEIRGMISDENKELTLDELNNLNDELDSLENEAKEIEQRRAIAKSIEQRTAVDTVVEEVVSDEEEGEEDMGNNEIETRQKMSKEVRSFLKYMMSGGKETRGVTFENGQAVVPEELDNEIITQMRDISDVINFINLKNVRGTLRVGKLSSITGNKDKDGETIKDNNDYNTLIGEVTFGSYRQSAIVEIGVGVDNSSLSAFKDTVIEELALALAEITEEQSISGTGTNEAEGMLSYKYPAAQLMSVSISELSHKTLATIKGKIKRAYGKRASYLINTETFHEYIEGMIGSDGHPIYNTNDEKLLNKPVIISDFVPKNKILFGYGKRYWFNYNMTPQIASSDQEKFSDGLIVHRALAFGDGHVMDSHAFAVLTITDAVDERIEG